ncbi:hypothetical protein Btru_023454 [Bulinus truncatus]|nr:hypothetical protein Btru_023454 [Bulinus truncatus]
MKLAPLLVVLYFTFTVSDSSLVSRDNVLQRIKVYSNPDVIPMVGASPLNVSVEYSLINILRADVEHNEIEILVKMIQSWTDPSLSWFGMHTNFSKLSVPTKYIWTPDITFHNAVGAPEVFASDQAVVRQDGTVSYVPKVRVRFTCDLKKMTVWGKLKSAFTRSDGVTCTLRSESWTHSAQEITLSLEKANLSEYFEGSKFDVLDASQKIRQVVSTRRYQELELSIDFTKK